MKEPTETQQRSHPLRASNLHFVLAWMLVNIASTAMAAPPSIDYPPRDQTVILYQQAAFGVIASGSAPLSYQWRKNAVPIVGATNDQVVIAQAHFSDSGLYSVAVSNAEGSVTSAEAVLTVNPPKPGDVDFSFGWGSSINGIVKAVVVQPDGKILIGGEFTTVHGAARRGIARLNADGTTDYTFMQGLSGTDGDVNSIVMQGDGKVLIGGYFSTVNGVPASGIARLNAGGALDSGFQITVSGDFPSVTSIEMQSDGKMLIRGAFSAINGVSHSGIARLNADGTLDSGFQFSGVIGSDSLRAFSILAVQSDGKVLIGGTPFNVLNRGIARLNADGTLDSGFQAAVSGEVPNSSVTSSALQSDGKVLIGGDFTTVNGVSRNNIARLNPDGTLDGGFQTAVSGGVPNSSVTSIAVQSDGKLLIWGRFATVNGVSRNNIARLNTDGTLDSGFQNDLFQNDPAGGSNGAVNSVAVQSDGRVLIAGYLANGQKIARVNADGTLDSGFQNDLFFGAGDFFRPPFVYSVAVQRDGKVLIGGWFDTVNGVSRNNIARLNTDGTLDSGFLKALPGTGSVDPLVDFPWVNLVMAQGDGKVLIGGNFTTVNGEGRANFARLNADGTLDSGFQTELSGAKYHSVYSVAVQSDGKVLIGGEFTEVNGVSASGIARLWGSADIPPQIKSIARSGADVNLTWDAAPNRSYRVQYKENLSANAWTDLAGDISTSTGTASKTDSTLGNASQRFYRVVLLP